MDGRQAALARVGLGVAGLEQFGRRAIVGPASRGLASQSSAATRTLIVGVAPRDMFAGLVQLGRRVSVIGLTTASGRETCPTGRVARPSRGRDMSAGLAPLGHRAGRRVGRHVRRPRSSSAAGRASGGRRAGGTTPRRTTGPFLPTSRRLAIARGRRSGRHVRRAHAAPLGERHRAHRGDVWRRACRPRTTRLLPERHQAHRADHRIRETCSTAWRSE